VRSSNLVAICVVSLMLGLLIGYYLGRGERPVPSVSAVPGQTTTWVDPSTHPGYTPTPWVDPSTQPRPAR
jgi:hypothetical protein